MKERPILFSGPMVRAILEGRKTMTRRVMKPQPIPPEGNLARDWPNTIIWGKNRDNLASWTNVAEFNRTGANWMSPFGEKGDRLWVKETFTTYKSDTKEERKARFVEPSTIKTLDDLYAWAELPSGGGETKVLYKSDFGDWGDNPDSDLGPWKPSIFMPRWASRITLEVVSVKVERLQDISHADVCYEGIRVPVNPPGGSLKTAQLYYRNLWERINGKKHPWESNPWVWVVEFEEVA